MILPLLSVVIPVIDEDPADLATTLRTIHEGTDGPVELIIVDDMSKRPLEHYKPETEAPGRALAVIRNERRLGATRSRKLGCERATGRYVAVLDAHMKIGDGNLRRLAALAEASGGIAYCGCNRHLACRIAMIDGLPVSKWHTVKRGAAPMRIDSMMGACYLMTRDVLMSMGGWIGLPGYLGWQELSMSILAWKCGVPITCDPGIENWHKFRTQPTAHVPQEGWLLNKVITLRWLFGDDAWNEVWKPRLLARPWRNRNDRAVPASLIAEAERPEYQAYGEELRSHMIRCDEECLAYLDWIKGGRKDAPPT